MTESTESLHTYKYMLLDYRNHLTEVIKCEFKDDTLACERAKAIYAELCPHEIEVWHMARLVCRVDSAGLHFTS
jgi:hypothetical protein